MSNKTCYGCRISKPETDFNKKKKGLQPFCRVCNALRSRAYYAANKEKHKAAATERKKKNIAFVQKYVYDLLQQKGCISCSENHPAALDFDHVRGEKYKNVSSLIAQGSSLESVLEEIEKCDIRCANCHRKRTAQTHGWYKNINTGTVA